MFNLFLAITTSAMIAIFMRISETKIKNNMVMFFTNYCVCTLLSLGFQFQGGIPDNLTGMPFTVILGIISGFMFLASFILLQLNIRKNGVILSSLFMKLGVLIPTITAAVVFGHSLNIVSSLGLILALTAIVLMNTDSSDQTSTAQKTSYLLIILLVSGGFTDTLSEIFSERKLPEFQDLYLIGTFAVAAVFAAILAVWKKQHITVPDILWGILIGIPNYFTTRFLLNSLKSLPGTIVYPSYNVGTILLVCLTGIAVFHEKITARKTIGIVLILAALVLLSL